MVVHPRWYRRACLAAALVADYVSCAAESWRDRAYDPCGPLVILLPVAIFVRHYLRMGVITMSFASSRRRFVKWGSLAACGLASGIMPRLFAADSADPWRGWPIGVQSYSLREFNTVEAIRHI